MEKIDKRTGEVVFDHRVVIKVKNTETNKARIHRYTEFLNEWRNCKVRTAINNADYIIPFLNYITFELSEKELPSVQHLTFEYAAEYLSVFGEGKNRNTVLMCDNTIKHFYYYLAKKGLLYYVNGNDFSFIKNKKGVPKLQSPFRGLYGLPKGKPPEKLHQIESELVFEFICTALEATPEIALGVYFQLFGGLRVSEVVSVLYSRIMLKEPYGRNGMVLILKNINKKLFRKGDILTSIKKERNQPVISIGNLLSRLYINHIKNYRLGGIDEVFIDKNGKPMSKYTYRRNFGKLKKAFLKRLTASNDLNLKLYASFLNTQKWSTHICRGTFSAIVADSAKTALEIAIWRGDSDLNSALAYLSDSKRLERKLISNMSKFYSDRISERISSLM